MAALVVVVGLLVGIGTPLGSYLAAVKGHKVAGGSAAASNQTARDEQRLSHFHWACDNAWSSDPTTSEGGIAILKSMLYDGELTHTDLVAVAGVLELVTKRAVSRAGDTSPTEVATARPAGEAGKPSRANGGSEA